MPVDPMKRTVTAARSSFITCVPMCLARRTVANIWIRITLPYLTRKNVNCLG
jgi:hypothetical protein